MCSVFAVSHALAARILQEAPLDVTAHLAGLVAPAAAEKPDEPGVVACYVVEVLASRWQRTCACLLQPGTPGSEGFVSQPPASPGLYPIVRAAMGRHRRVVGAGSASIHSKDVRVPNGNQCSLCDD